MMIDDDDDEDQLRMGLAEVFLNAPSMLLNSEHYMNMCK